MRDGGVSEQQWNYLIVFDSLLFKTTVPHLLCSFGKYYYTKKSVITRTNWQVLEHLLASICGNVCSKTLPFSLSIGLAIS